jgi:hypothetical protein
MYVSGAYCWTHELSVVEQLARYFLPTSGGCLAVVMAMMFFPWDTMDHALVTSLVREPMCVPVWRLTAQ